MYEKQILQLVAQEQYKKPLQTDFYNLFEVRKQEIEQEKLERLRDQDEKEKSAAERKNALLAAY